MVSRQPKKTSLRDLMKRMPPHDEVLGHLLQLRTAPDRTSAIVGAAHVEYALKRAILRKCIPLGPEGEDELFDDSKNGPLINFFARTRMAFALGVIDADVRSDLDCLRRIRNAFAHTAAHAEFTSPEIEDECKKLNSFDMTDAIDFETAPGLMKRPKLAFMLTVIIIYTNLTLYGAGVKKFVSRWPPLP